MMIIGVFDLTPLSRIVSYLLLVVSTIGHLFFFKYHRFFSKSFRFWYSMGLALMVLSIIMQNIINNQSFISGFVANVRFYKVGGVVFVYFWLLKYKISPIKLFEVLRKAGWLNFLVILTMVATGFIFSNESDITGVVTEVDAGKIQKTFVNLIAIIYLSYFISSANYKYLFYALILFSAHHLEEIQRFALLVQLCVVMIAFMKVQGKKLKYRLFIQVIFAISFSILFLFSSESGSSIVDRFSQAFSIFTAKNASSINDASSAARIYETDIAMEHFYASPLVGNGFYRSSESEYIFEGAHFYLSDIGVVGILYVFGVLGIIVLMLQYRFLFKSRVLMGSNVLVNASFLFLFYFMLMSLLTGQSILNYCSFVLCVFLIEYTQLLKPKKSYK
jgi:hypothetical protein